MDSNVRSVQSEMAVPSCTGSPGWKTCSHLMSQKKGGYLYYNYKRFHSIMSLHLVDVDYKFIWADMGSNGAASDAQTFTDPKLKEAIENNIIGFPPADLLPNNDRNTPYIIVRDDAVSLRM